MHTGTAKIVLTGDRPTGKLHLGHYVGSLKQRIELQKKYTQYVMIADVQALTDNFHHSNLVTQNVYEVLRDYIAVGIDPSKTTIFLQSQIPSLTELTIYYLNLVTISRLQRNPTLKAEIQQKKYENNLLAGFCIYPVSQAADITAFDGELIPIGEDQLPMIEQTNEIVRKFNSIYGDTLKEAIPMLGTTKRLSGIDGKAKASKSLNNAIYLSDSADTIKQKVLAMFTDPNHLKVSDPGNIEGNIVFEYLDAFHENKDEVIALKEHYTRGGLGDIALKNILNDTLQELIAPYRERRSNISHIEMQNILYDGCKKANKKAEMTLYKVKKAIGLHYFDEKFFEN
ncbi:Tryptophan--tRNA ligase [Candidatus Fokinia solitaria]|uniref:Tryptophan--tRNA ligase n=1 Tax=Candidatus Fokinia solitaria TaxID=1802984 RepID=A0A2U8BRY5_9RICK|nr:tryptophan--tRNA ligase [Candidatus Fokinia solitaria]AWD33065.1 Tryptophan--tRNA ligase [Candidatus Fokinia solitaria]